MQAVDINGKYHDVSPDEVSWRPSAYGIVIRDGQILLSPQHGKGYDLPGGGVDIDETFEQAVLREVKEETGLDVRIIRFLTMRENIFIWKPEDAAKRGMYHSILCYYLCEYVSGEVSKDGFGEEEKQYAELAEWINLDQLDVIIPATSYDWREIVRQV